MTGELEKLKKRYTELKEKYELPNYEEINNNFEIEKVVERETDILIRVIRECIMERITSYLRLVEMLLNPQNAPLFSLKLTGALGGDDIKLLEELHEKFGMLELESLSLDVGYDEKREAEFVKRVNDMWNKEVKEKLRRLFDSLKLCWKKKSEKRDKGYLG